MNYKRRNFLKVASAFASGIALTGIGGQLAGCGSTSKLTGNNNKFGLQLYSLRDDLPKDPKGILTQVASFGYKQLEGFEGPQGIYWGMKNTEFKSFLDQLGMQIVSSHCNYKEDLERKADEAAAIGMKYLLCPYLGPQKDLDAFKRAAEGFNKAGEICRQRGLRFAYHNHDYLFKQVEGQYPQDVMMQNTDKNLVDFELDMYWVVAAGQDPIEWFKKYPNRFRLGHVKDKKGDETTTLGKGTINYPAILKEAEKQGMQYFIVEQEQYEGTTPLAAAKDDAEYMKNLKV
ncbi:sugar phosphate isomerase/epimerase family protein [Segetibacter koreensis]|uniref:sugar phosphate isomerase/epimerase family protein n=1 Tax=Segetibacter koreensis TaxID=398037 RepID=UPI00036D3801|nr:sugar phosphate isomerase/epimerase [Segetibacter koreensis]